MKTNKIGGMRSNRVRRAWVASVCAAVTLVAGCGSSGSNESNGSAGNATHSEGAAGADSQSPTSSLTVVQTNPLTQLNPISVPLYLRSVTLQMYDTLTRENSQLKPQPRLAEKWKFENDDKDLILTLRNGIKFSDGSPIDASAIVWNIEYQKDPDNGANVAKLLTAVKSVTAVDSSHVKLEFTRPADDIFDAFDLLFILKPKQTKTQLASNPVTSGPFKVKKFVPGTSLSLVPNGTFWGPAPKVSEIDIKTVSDPQSAASALEANNADIFMQPTGEIVNQLRNGKNTTVKALALNPTMLSLEMNTKRTSLKDPNVRQAIVYALDRDRVAKLAYAGMSAAWCLPWPEASPAFDEKLARDCPQDLKKASQLLEQAGYSSSHKLELTIGAIQTLSDGVVLAQVLAASLNQLGMVDAKVQKLSRDIAGNDFQNGNFDVLAWSFSRANRSLATALGTAVVWLPGTDWTGFDSPAYQQVYDRVVNGTASTADIAKLNQLILQDPFTVTVAPTPTLVASQKAVSGVDGDLSGNLLLEGASK